MSPADRAAALVERMLPAFPALIAHNEEWDDLVEAVRREHAAWRDVPTDADITALEQRLVETAQFERDPDLAGVLAAWSQAQLARLDVHQEAAFALGIAFGQRVRPTG